MRPSFPTALLAGLAAGAALVSLGTTADPAASEQRLERAKGCGTYESTSLYSRAKVIALRGVGCRKARRIAKRFDRTGDLTIGHWRCALAHSDLPNLFSCGWPANGDLRQSDHALLARGVPGTQ